jgi:hypothetical protein
MMVVFHTFETRTFIHYVSLESCVATEFNKMLPGRQKRRDVEVKDFHIWTLLSAKEHLSERLVHHNKVLCADRLSVLCAVIL